MQVRVRPGVRLVLVWVLQGDHLEDPCLKPAQVARAGRCGLETHLTRIFNSCVENTVSLLHSSSRSLWRGTGPRSLQYSLRFPMSKCVWCSKKLGKWFLVQAWAQTCSGAPGKSIPLSGTRFPYVQSKEIGLETRWWSRYLSELKCYDVMKTTLF